MPSFLSHYCNPVTICWVYDIDATIGMMFKMLFFSHINDVIM